MRDTDVEIEFCRLICTGKVDEPGALLAEHPELLERSVHCAAVWGDTRAVAEHLEQDAARANAILDHVWSPLMLASLSHRGRADQPHAADIQECVQLLLEHGADVSAGIPHDELPAGRLTVLAAAAGVTGNAALCHTILDAGAPPNDGVALFLATAEQHWECVAQLIAVGGDLNATDDAGRFAPLHWILDLRYDHAAVERVLAEGADPNLRVGPLQENALHVAVRRRRVEVLRTLVAAGADVNARTTGGMTPFRHAVRRNFTEVADKLVELGADDTRTPGDALAVALHEGRIAEARALLRRDAKLVPAGIPEETRLLPDLAAAGKREAVHFLLDAGVDIASRGLDAGTALHQTGWFGQPEVARLLVERGAPLDLRGDDHDCTPLGWVAHGSRYSGGAAERQQAYAEVAEILLEAGAPVPQPGEQHDRAQLAQASEAVTAVLRRFGWSSKPASAS